MPDFLFNKSKIILNKKKIKLYTEKSPYFLV